MSFVRAHPPESRIRAAGSAARHEEVIPLQFRTFRAAAAALALALALSACGASAADSASSAAEPTATPAPTPLSDTFRLSTEYDYRNFDYSMSITEDGLWQGVTALDHVTLPEDYAAIPMQQADITPTDEQLAKAVNDTVSLYAPAALGDTVNIDYVGTVKGVAFVGGNTQGMGYDLTLGSGAFIDTFEDQIVGHKVGESFDVTVTFPQGYRDSTDAAGNTVVLSGAQAVFSVTLNAISYGWELTDDWVARNLEQDYDVVTVAQLNAYLTDQLLTSNKQSCAVRYLLENAVFADPLPDTVLDYMVCQYLSFYDGYADYNGQTLEDFVTGTIHYGSIDEMLADNEASIVAAAKRALLYQAVAEATGLTLDAADAAQYDSYVSAYGQNYVNQFALTQQVLAYLADHAQVS